MVVMICLEDIFSGDDQVAEELQRSIQTVVLWMQVDGTRSCPHVTIHASHVEGLVLHYGFAMFLLILLPS